MSDETKFCVDCQWHRRPRMFTPGWLSHAFDRCEAPLNFRVSTNPVTGVRKRTAFLSFCETQRGSSSIGACGTDARWFQAKGSDDYRQQLAARDAEIVALRDHIAALCDHIAVLEREAAVAARDKT